MIGQGARGELGRRVRGRGLGKAGGCPAAVGAPARGRLGRPREGGGAVRGGLRSGKRRPSEGRVEGFAGLSGGRGGGWA